MNTSNTTPTNPVHGKLIQDVIVPRSYINRNFYNALRDKNTSVGELQATYQTYTRIPPLSTLPELLRSKPMIITVVSTSVGVVGSLGNKLSHLTNSFNHPLFRPAATTAGIVSVAVALLAFAPFNDKTTPSNGEPNVSPSIPISAIMHPQSDVGNSSQNNNPATDNTKPISTNSKDVMAHVATSPRSTVSPSADPSAESMSSCNTSAPDTATTTPPAADQPVTTPVIPIVPVITAPVEVVPIDVPVSDPGLLPMTQQNMVQPLELSVPELLDASLQL